MKTVDPRHLIYGFGMNGDDLPYDLRKTRGVVGIEADPALCGAIAARFVAAVRKHRSVKIARCDHTAYADNLSSRWCL